ncbi:MAG: recombinase family protein [Kiritimatiellae bacterium]|nr:recombinase family protein [Kiritimatiellia bacterium]
MNAVIYARYSSHSQTEQSIEGQLRDAYEYAKREGLTVIGEYIDRAKSARTDDRADFQRMLDDAAKKQFQIVIVWKLDRFARNRAESAINKLRLKKCGVRVVSVKQNITDSPEGIILEGLLEAMDEYYSANLSVNIKRGQRENVAKGHFCGGAVSYGHKAVDKRLVANEKTAPHFIYYMEHYAAGEKESDIIAELRRRGAKDASGKPVSAKTFALARLNSACIGKYMYNGEEVKGCAERLVSDETFRLVCERVARNARAPAAAKAAVEYHLQGKAFCGYCGKPMVGESGKSRNGVIHRYYACADRKKKHTCKKRNEKKDQLECFIVDQTVKYVLTPSRAAVVAKAVVEEFNKEFDDSKAQEYERVIKRIDRELDNLVDALVEAPKVAHKKIYEKMELLEAQKADAENDLAHLRIAQELRFTEAEVRAWLREVCKGDPDDPAFRRRIIDIFVSSVYLYDDRFVVFYNMRDGKQVAYTDLISTLDTPLAPSSGSDLSLCAPPQRPSQMRRSLHYT